MKNFFEFFGFISMAGISAVLIFIFIGGKKDLSHAVSRDGLLSEISTSSDASDAPRTISDRPMRSRNVAGQTEKGSRANAFSSEMAPEEKLKSLYGDAGFVAATAKQWKGLVSDAADEYNVKPQVLLAQALVQSYLGDYSREQLYADAARHAGDRIKPTAVAVKGYKFGWSMQKLMQEHNLDRYFPEESSAGATMAASVGMSERSSARSTTTAKSAAKNAMPVAKTNPLEEGFKNMVAKEYGFGSWAGMQKLADPETKAEAVRRVKSLTMASRIR